MKKSRILAAIAVAGVMAASAVGGAQADPTGAPTFRELAGGGSDTTQDVMNSMADAITIGGVKVLGSYDAGVGTISPKAAANCTGITRPNGSSAGRAALLAATKTPATPTAGCFQWARSSSLNLGNTNPAGTTGNVRLTYIPFAVDNLTFAVNASSNLPKDLTQADLTSIYNCEFPGVKALLPQSLSGTRADWLLFVGKTEAQITPLKNTPANPAGCIYDTFGGAGIQEHNGVPVDADSIVPYSVGKWLQQSTGTISDVHGNTVLGKIAGQLAAVPSDNFASSRNVYNIIPTSTEGTAPYSTVFVGPTSSICTNVAIIANNGLAQSPECGSVTRKTAL